MDIYKRIEEMKARFRREHPPAPTDGAWRHLTNPYPEHRAEVAAFVQMYRDDLEAMALDRGLYGGQTFRARAAIAILGRMKKPQIPTGRDRHSGPHEEAADPTAQLRGRRVRPMGAVTDSQFHRGFKAPYHPSTENIHMAPPLPTKRHYTSRYKPPPEAAGLTRKQRLFCELFVTNPTLRHGEVALLAGFGRKRGGRPSETNLPSAQQTAARQLRNPKILALIRRLVEDAHAILPSQATAVITSIMAGTLPGQPAELKVRLEAARTALAMGGMAPVTRSEHRIEQTVTHQMDLDSALNSLRRAGIKLAEDEPEIIDLTPTAKRITYTDDNPLPSH